VSGGSYARQAINFATAASGKMANNARIDFPTATTNWGTAVAVVILDDPTAGNMLQFDSLPVSRAVLAGDQPYFLTGEIEWDEA
jgi:hypothetical protein